MRNSSSASVIGANNRLDRQLPDLFNAREATIDHSKSKVTDHHESATTKFNHSPTPSTKRGKAEKLLKEHGSPPGMRVTAGGRVVPADLASLGSPRFSRKDFEKSTLRADLYTGSSKVQFATTKFIPATCVPYHYNDFSSFVNEGQIPGFSHDDNFDADKGLYFAHSVFDRYLPWSIDWQLPEPSTTPILLSSRPDTFNSQAQTQLYPAANMGLHDSELVRKQKGLEQQYAKMDFDLREFEKQQVLKQETMTSSERHTTVQRKKEMIIELDKVRKAIKETKQQLGITSYTVNERSLSQPFANYTQPVYSYAVSSNSLRDAVSSFVIDNKNVLNDSEVNSRYNQEPVTVRDTLQDHSLTSLAQIGYLKQAVSNVEERPSTYRRHIESLMSENNEYRSYIPRSNSYSVIKSSHAIPIKDPENSSRILRNKKTSLDPTSPNYEPRTLASISKGAEALSPTCPSNTIALNSTEDDYEKRQSQGEEFNDLTCYLHRDRIIGRVSSFSSVATADFFPKNTAEHSSAKYNFPRATAGNSNEFSLNTAHVWNVETLRKDQDRLGQPLLPKSADVFGPIAPPVSPADLCSRRSTAEKSDHTTKETSNAFNEHVIPTGLAEDTLLRALTKYQNDKGHDGAPTQVDIEGRSTTFVEGLYAGLLHGLIPPVTDSDFEKGYCIGLMNSRKNTVVSARANSSDESHQSSIGSLKSDIRPVIEPQRPVNLEQSEVSSRSLSKAYSLQGDHSLLPKCENKSFSTASNNNHSSVAPTLARKAEQPIGHFNSNGNISKVSVLPNAWSVIQKEPSSGFQATQATSNYYVSENAAPKGTGLIGQHVDSFASRIRTYPSYTVYGFNQSSKSGFSVAPSNDQANGLFQQYDGAVGELKDLNGSNSNGSSPSAPIRKLPYNKEDESHPSDTLQPDLSPKPTKETPNSPARSQISKKASHSPTKAKIGNLTTMIKNTIKSGEERSDEPSEVGKHNFKDKSRRKDNWRENWRKRFQEIKIKEKEEIEKYKRENPVE